MMYMTRFQWDSNYFPNARYIGFFVMTKRVFCCFAFERDDVDEVMNEHPVGIEGGENQFCRSLLSMMSCK